MINLKEYFGAAYVINLDCRLGRLSKFNEMVHRAGVTGIQRYRAVEGEKSPHPEWWRSGNGAWGCLMTHLRLAQDALMDGIESYIVFEDDAVFSKDFAERLPVVMDEIKSLNGEWDMLYLGGQHLWKETSPPWPWTMHTVRCANVNRTHGFAVNARFMVKFAQHVMHTPDYIASHVKPVAADKRLHIEEVKEFMNHIDHQLGGIHKDIVTLAVDPWMCGQAAGSSSVNGQMQEEQWWPSKGWGKGWSHE